MTIYPVYPISQLVSDAWTLDALRCAGFGTTRKFLKVAKDAKGRAFLRKTLNLEPERALSIANASDLMRIHRLGREHVAALRAVGVHTVRDLRMRNPGTLFNSIREANEMAHFMKFPPPLSFVRQWVAEAKTLELVISY